MAKIVPLHAKADAPAQAIPPFVQRTFHTGVPLVDLTKANQLAAELEDEELIEKMRRIEQDYQERHAAS